MLIMGSFVPWIHYGFYCRPTLQVRGHFHPLLILMILICGVSDDCVIQIIYIGMIIILGTAAMIVSLWDKFAEPKFR